MFKGAAWFSIDIFEEKVCLGLGINAKYIEKNKVIIDIIITSN